MSAFTPGELLALYAILTTSRAPGAPKLAEKVRREYQEAPRGTNEEESQGEARRRIWAAGGQPVRSWRVLRPTSSREAQSKIEEDEQ